MDRAGASDSEDDLAGASVHRIQLKAKRNMAPKAAVKTATKRKAAPKQSRTALKDRTNVQSPGSVVEEFEDDVPKPKAKRAKTTITAKSRTKKAEPVIPETQQEAPEDDDIECSIEEDHIEMVIEKVPTPPLQQPFYQRPRSASVQPLIPQLSAHALAVHPVCTLPRSRSGSAQPGERRGGDPEMRRRLNELTKKHEDLQLKYQNLQEIGEKSAETNFENLKRASNQKAKDAQDLIASLKKEIAELRKTSSTTSSETTGLQKQVAELKTANQRLVDASSKHAAEVADLKEKVQTAANEYKSLEAKLVAARQQAANSVQESRVPASVTKANTRSAASNTTTDAQKEAKMKENLYSDLTGLIIRGVKRKEGEDEYDCLQTGRNGTLHFHLSVANDASVSNPKTPTGLSYEEAEFAYEPFLDENRDRDLLALLPDYLAEEICFPRGHAVKFYSKVVESMTKRFTVEEEEGE